MRIARIGIMTAMAHIALLALASAQSPSLCGDCNGDGQISIIDSLQAAQNGVGTISLASPAFGRCNVNGTRGDLGVPGADVGVLDALLIAQASAGLGVAVGCATTTGCTISSPAGGSEGGDVDIVFTVIDPQSTATTLSFEANGGAGFTSATVAPGSPIPTNPFVQPAPASGLIYRWRTTTDFPSSVANALFRVIVNDGTSMVACSTRFEVNNSPIDLRAVSVVPASTMVSPGGSLDVTRTFANDGTAAAGASTEAFYVSTDMTFSVGDARIMTFATPGIGAGAMDTRMRTLTVPLATAPGTYFIIAVADDTSTIAEADETNNSITSATTVMVGSCAAPMISLVSPASGPAEGGNTILISGSGFVAGMAVTIGGDPATEVLVIPPGAPCGGMISARVPPAAAGEDGASVAVTVGTATMPAGYAYRSDSVGPQVAGTCPAAFALTISNSQRIAFYFDARINPATVQDPTPAASTATAMADTLFVAGMARTSEDLRFIVLRRSSGVWPAGTQVSAFVFGDVAGVSAIGDLHGNAIITTGGIFATRRFDGWFSDPSVTIVADSTAPTLVSSVPGAGAIDVRRAAALHFEFSEAIDPSTLRLAAGGPVTAATLIVRPAGGGPAATGRIEVGVDCRSARYYPDLPLTPATAYEFVLSSATASARVEDLSGNGMAPLTVGFTTGSQTGFAVVAAIPDEGDSAGGETVVITGEGFGPGATVAIGGRAATAVQRLSSSQLAAITPTAATAGAVDIVVTNTDGAIATGVGLYTYRASRPIDTQRLEVLFEYPIADPTGSAAIAANSKVVLVFSEPPSTATEAFSLGSAQSIDIDGGAGTATRLSSDPRIVVLSRTMPFTTTADIVLYSTQLAMPSIGMRDLAGNRLLVAHPDLRFTAFSGNPALTFQYALGAPDLVPPSILTRAPATGSSANSTRAPVRLTFSEQINPLTVETGFIVSDGMGAVPGALAFDLDTMSGFTFTPLRDYSGAVTVDPRTIADLAGLAIGGATYGFTTTGDTQAPTIDFLTINAIPSYINGDIASGGGRAIGGRLRVPSHGFTIDIDYSDAGGIVDASPASFMITSSTAVSGNPAGTNLAPLFGAGNARADSQSASFLVPAHLAFPAGTSAASAMASTITVRVRDLAGNLSPSRTFTFDCLEPIGSALALDSLPDVWHLEFFRNQEDMTLSFGAYTATIAGGDGCPTPDAQVDFDEDLQGYGINSLAPFSPSGAALVSGGGISINTAARNWVINRVQHHLYRFYGMSTQWDDGNPNPGFAATIDLVPAGSLDALNMRFRHATASPGATANRLAFGGWVSTAVGRAVYDSQNDSRDHDNGESCVSPNLGVFTAVTMASEYDGSPSGVGSSFRQLFDPITPFTGGVTPRPIGNSADDAFILSPAADPTTFTAARRDRYDQVLAAMDGFARLWAAVAAHEIGHSLGLVEDGDPGLGLYGGDVAAFPGAGTTSHHIDLTPFYPGNGENLMRAGIAFNSSLSRNTVFNGLVHAYLSNRVIAGMVP